MVPAMKVINLSDVKVKPRPAGFAAVGGAADRFDAMRGDISRPLGAEKLGYNLTVVPPGKAAFPLHNHHVNEELFLILEGRGELRVGNDVTTVKPMDVIACPPGGPETAHQLINTGDEVLKYLAVSTLESVDYVEYPDSGKFGVYGTRAGVHQQGIHYVGREEDAVDYWDGE